MVYLEGMLEEYYNLGNWDAEKGWPTREKLVELGLSFVDLASFSRQ